MIPDYPKEQLWDIYKNLPQDLREAMFSEDSGNIIYDICSAEGIKDEDKVTKAAKLVGFVFLGILSPRDLAKELAEALNLSSQSSQTIAEQITNQLFFPIKDSLEALYQIKMKFSKPNKKPVPPPVQEPKEETPKTAEQKPVKKDSYREPFE